VSSFSHPINAAKTTLRATIACGVLAIGFSALIAAAPAIAAENSDDEEPSYFRVNMQPGGTLNVRQDPSLKGKKVGALTADAQGIVNLGCHVGMPYLEWKDSTTAIRKVETRRKWCNIEYNGMTGWTAGQYLEADLRD